MMRWFRSSLVSRQKNSWNVSLIISWTRKKTKDRVELSCLLSMTCKHVEKALYENGGDRGKYLNYCYHYLISIPLTSIETERAFSNAARVFAIKLGPLSESTWNALCFLRAQNKNIKKISLESLVFTGIFETRPSLDFFSRDVEMQRDWKP